MKVILTGHSTTCAISWTCANWKLLVGRSPWIALVLSGRVCSLQLKTQSGPRPTLHHFWSSNSVSKERQETIKFDEGLKQTVDWFSVLAPGSKFLEGEALPWISMALLLYWCRWINYSINVPPSLEWGVHGAAFWDTCDLDTVLVAHPVPIMMPDTPMHVDSQVRRRSLWLDFGSLQSRNKTDPSGVQWLSSWNLQTPDHWHMQAALPPPPAKKAYQCFKHLVSGGRSGLYAVPCVSGVASKSS